MTSALDSEYIQPTRPYSQLELNSMQEKLYRKLGLGKTVARHSNCNHFYLVKRNGRKEKEMHEQKNNDVGNCSVCWKLRKTPASLRQKANGIIKAYGKVYQQQENTYNKIDIETVYYQWLYNDFN